MRKVFIVLVLTCILGLSIACTGVVVNSPIPTVDTVSLQKQIDDLQTQITNAKSDKSELQTKLDVVQDKLNKATALDDSNWIFPAKVEYRDYRTDAMMTYVIRVHNGSDEQKDFTLVTERWHSNSEVEAFCPKNISDWVIYDPASPLTLKAKETKDVAVTFNEPIDQRFYSITQKGLDFTGSLSESQQLILNDFVTNKTITKDKITPEWADLVGQGLIVPDNQWEWITAYAESNGGNIVSRSAIRWIITMSEFSK
jgi:hypothetical protein